MNRIGLATVAAVAAAFVVSSVPAESFEWAGNPGPIRRGDMCWSGQSAGTGRDVYSGYWAHCKPPVHKAAVQPEWEWAGNPGPTRRGNMCWKGQTAGTGRDVYSGYWT